MTRMLAALLLVAVSGVAAAQTVTVTNEAGQTETARTEPAAPADARAASDRATAATAAAATDATDAAASKTCLRSTGSRIVDARNLRAQREGKPQQCTNAAGRVYTREDLDRSGYVDIADALRALDTSIR